VLGAWAAITWDSMGRPNPVILAEAGPGRGTLMADALRAVARVAPGFRAALRLHLVESSPRLRAIQGAVLPEAVWHDALETLPPGPVILLANEFLDALPIRQFVQRDGVWLERYVADGAWVEQPAEPPAGASGAVWETRDPGVAVWLGARLRDQGGAALFLDYGPSGSGPGDSLQALRDGTMTDPLADPGASDLTAHVDFPAFAAAAGVPAYGPLAQGKFLTRLGLFQRINRLAQTQQPRRAMAMIEAGRRLAEPDRMGALFKVMALTQPGLGVPAGFED
jgi:NADH dehydrogenase [ubiquinone] 1 alpha subcomplex assembly factor 7